MTKTIGVVRGKGVGERTEFDMLNKTASNLYNKKRRKIEKEIVFPIKVPSQFLILYKWSDEKTYINVILYTLQRIFALRIINQ